MNTKYLMDIHTQLPVFLRSDGQTFRFPVLQLDGGVFSRPGTGFLSGPPLSDQCHGFPALQLDGGIFFRPGTGFLSGPPGRLNFLPAITKTSAATHRITVSAVRE